MSRPVPTYGVAACAAVTAELVRLTLGLAGPSRPELEKPVWDDRTQHAKARRPRRRKG